MAELGDLTVKVRIRGLWKIALLGWAIRLFRLGPQHVTFEIKS